MTTHRQSVPAQLLADQHAVILAYLRRRVRDPHVAEDLAQEALLRGLRHLPRLRSPEALTRWLRRIAYHIAMDWHRHGGRPGRAAVQLDDAPPLWTSGPRPRLVEEGRREGRYWSDRLRRALALLGRRDRMLLIAHYFVGLSCREIARRCGLSVANVKVRLHRARRVLRDELPSESRFREWLALRSEANEAATGQRQFPMVCETTSERRSA